MCAGSGRWAMCVCVRWAMCVQVVGGGLCVCVCEVGYVCAGSGRWAMCVCV